MLSIFIIVGSAPAGHRLLQWLNMPLRENEWTWNIIAAAGTILFGLRWFVQWVYAERIKESKVPAIFWWQSLMGALLLLMYALRQRDLWFALMYVFTFIPYSRNLVLMYRQRNLAQAMVHR
jgi:lipid-A-disaccharide synthase-like uncharacterized protein